jgi:hypothetical protein
MKSKTYTLQLTSDEASHLSDMLEVHIAKFEPETDEEGEAMASVKTMFAKVCKFWEPA